MVRMQHPQWSRCHKIYLCIYILVYIFIFIYLLIFYSNIKYTVSLWFVKILTTVCLKNSGILCCELELYCAFLAEILQEENYIKFCIKMHNEKRPMRVICHSYLYESSTALRQSECVILS
jgi:hypothetical protein